jgi:hypothetical protein
MIALQPAERSSIAWLKRSIGPPLSCSQRMIGVAGNAPTATSGAAGSLSPINVAATAKAATV